MKTFILLPSIILLLILSSCNQDEQPQIELKECDDVAMAAGNIDPPTYYEIANALINNLRSIRYAETDYLHINFISKESNLDVERMTQILAWEPIPFVVEEEETLLNYLEENETSGFWNDNFENGRLMAREEFLCFFTNTAFGEESYKNKYPLAGTFISMTKPVLFIQDQKEYALMEYSSPCNGDLVLLEKVDGAWEVVKYMNHVIC